MRHHREWALAYVLCAILVLNILALVLLSNRIEEQRVAVPNVPTPQPVREERPIVRAVLLEDRDACPDCFNISEYARALESTIPLAVESGDWAAWEARLAADSRVLPNAQRLPAIAFNETLGVYPQLLTDWDQVGYTITFGSGPYQGSWFVLPTLNPPYLNTATGEIQGRVTVTYLTMQSCKECYDPRELGKFVEEIRITPYEERTIDVSEPEGRELVRTYAITRVPTILLSKEAIDYPGFAPGWEVVGSTEEDGTLILRDLERILLTHYNLETGKVMKP